MVKPLKTTASWEVETGTEIWFARVIVISNGLYFMGYYDSLRGFIYESNLASRRMVQEIRQHIHCGRFELSVRDRKNLI